MSVLPWVVTALVAGGCAFCLWLLAGHLDQTRTELATTTADLAAVKKWIAENFRGPKPLVLVDEPTQPQPVVGDDTEPMRRVEVAGGARVRPSPRPRGRHRADVTGGLTMSSGPASDMASGEEAPADRRRAT